MTVSGKGLGIATRRVSNFQRLSRACSFQDDLKTLTEQLLRVRRERLQRLYTRELEEWQAELVAKGLSLEQGP